MIPFKQRWNKINLQESKECSGQGRVRQRLLCKISPGLLRNRKNNVAGGHPNMPAGQQKHLAVG